MSLLVNDIPEAEAIALILDELSRSRKQHPVYPDDPLRRTAIMCEESGEALKEAVDLTRTTPVPTLGDQLRSRNQLFQETVQTGAMAVKLLVAMIKERGTA